MSKAIAFTARKFDAATLGFIGACGNLDKSAADNAKAINHWAAMGAAGVASGALTLDAIKEGLIARFPGAKSLKECGGTTTINGRYFALKAIIDGGAGQRLVNGEALNPVANEVRAKSDKTASGKGKRRSSKGSKAAPRPAGAGIGWLDAVTALNGWLATASGDVELAKAMAASGELASVIAKIGSLSAMVERHAKAETAKAARNAKGKAASARAKLAPATLRKVA